MVVIYQTDLIEIEASKITSIVLVFKNTSDNVAFTLNVDGFTNTFGGAKKLKGEIMTKDDSLEVGITLE